MEGIVKNVISVYGYNEVCMLIVEMIYLFSCVIGEVIDVVEKEMYMFEDCNGDSLLLCFEGIVGCVCFGIENGLLYN